MTKTVLTQLAELQSKWYKILQDNGFDDIEDHESKNNEYLKVWSGISHLIQKDGEIIDLLDLCVVQSPLMEIKTSFPDPLLTNEESLLHHPKFDLVCENICSHGRHKLIPIQIKEILILHIEGKTERSIGQTLNINDTLVHRTIKALQEWSKVMPNPDEIEDIKTVVVRAYDEDVDAPLVFSTWRDALWFEQERDEAESIQFYRAVNKKIRFLLAMPDTKIKIACLKDDPDIIIGYSVVNKDNVIWTYVKFDYRRKGIANLLCKGLKSVSFPLTRIGEKIVRLKNLKVFGENSEQSEDVNGNQS